LGSTCRLLAHGLDYIALRVRLRSFSFSLDVARVSSDGPEASVKYVAALRRPLAWASQHLHASEFGFENRSRCAMFIQLSLEFCEVVGLVVLEQHRSSLDDFYVFLQGCGLRSSGPLVWASTADQGWRTRGPRPCSLIFVIFAGYAGSACFCRGRLLARALYRRVDQLSFADLLSRI